MVFGNNFNYKHQVENNKHRYHDLISVERTWDKNYWPDRCDDYYLALAEVNVNYLQGYLIDRVDAEPQLDFWRQLGLEMVDNTLDEETESGGVDGIRMRARRGNLG